MCSLFVLATCKRSQLCLLVRLEYQLYLVVGGGWVVGGEVVAAAVCGESNK